MWLFDHSSCHGTMAEGTLVVNKMNVNPEGQQRVMQDGWWGGKPQPMNYALGLPKALRKGTYCLPPSQVLLRTEPHREGLLKLQYYLPTKEHPQHTWNRKRKVKHYTFAYLEGVPGGWDYTTTCYKIQVGCTVTQEDIRAAVMDRFVFTTVSVSCLPLTSLVNENI